MKNPPYFFVFGLLILLCFTSGIAQTKARKIELNKTVNTFSLTVIRALNHNRDSMKYKLESKNIFYSDVDKDGDFDAVVELFFCERGSCHSTTNSSKLAIFLNSGKNFRMIAERSFRLYGKINSIDNGKIRIDVYDLEEDDPQCCPEMKRSEIYALKGTKLVRVN